MRIENWTAWQLAEIFIATNWTPRAMEDAARDAPSGNRPRKWLRNLIADILERSSTPYAPSAATLSRLIKTAPAFLGLRLDDREKPLFEDFFEPAPGFSPIPAFRDIGQPELVGPADLAHWLNLSPRHLEWFADIEGYRASAAAESTRHYVQAWIPKRTGPPRLIEAPKQILKGFQ